MGSTYPAKALTSPDGGKKKLDLFYDDNYRELVTNLPRLGARTRARRAHQFYVPPRYQLDYSG